VSAQPWQAPKISGESLLFKGDDFPHTDIIAVDAPQHAVPIAQARSRPHERGRHVKVELGH